ncbi:MAG: tetratricopeptide repeat protein [Planctomycetota bacterium]|nr:MAG: tetratricopeptide repeat protein [Planctomycetota bacterium]
MPSMPASRVPILALTVLVAGASGGCGGAGAAGPPPARPRSALVITLDTTRADALGCYGGKDGVTPNLDALARESVLYEQARAVAPLTLPSHISMFTGLYPPRHSVRTNSLMALPAAATTLAERAAGAGFQTSAFVAALVLDGAYGLSQGFRNYTQPLRKQQSALRIKDTPAANVVRAATQWLRQTDRSRPFLLWVHLFDPHEPYEPSEEFLNQAGGDPYLGEVAATDAAVGYLLGKLREMDRMDETMVVVIADHGEGRGDHGELTHSTLCYDTTLLVPLLVRYPDGWGAGTRARDVVSGVDVYPTLIEALGLGDPGDVDGVSLFGRRPPPGRGVYFETYDGFLSYGWSPLTGWADERGKYLHSSQPELFDVRDDPHESRNLVAERQEDAVRYRERLSALAQRPAFEATRGAVDPALLEAVQSLGYTGAGDVDSELPDPLDTRGLPSPQSRLNELYRFYAASTAGEQGKFDEAVRLLQQVVDQNPRNATAMDLLGYFLNQSRRFQDAITVLEKLQALGPPERHSMHTNFGHAYEELGDELKALQHYERAAQLSPNGPLVLGDWARMLEKTGQAPAAAAVRARIDELTRAPRPSAASGGE